MSLPERNAPEIKVWDPLVRVGHWSLVAAFTAAYLTGDESSLWHEWLGYAVLALVAVRTLWGFVGTRYARFSDFVYPPRTVLRYARDVVRARAHRYVGHNPLGGAMIVVLLACLATTSITGWLLPAPGPASAAVAAAGHSTAAARESESEAGEQEGPLEEVHEFFANLTLALVLLHIGGVIATSIAHRENLVRAMMTGRKRPPRA